eukprot:jgi/Mesvir1/10683/Mv13774-RA.1
MEASPSKPPSVADNVPDSPTTDSPTTANTTADTAANTTDNTTDTLLPTVTHTQARQTAAPGPGEGDPFPKRTGFPASSPGLQDVIATPYLGASILGAFPLADRLRMRGLCRGFKSSVDASLEDLHELLAQDLFQIDAAGRNHDHIVQWLASKCPRLQALDLHKGASGLLGPTMCWRRVPTADETLAQLAPRCRQLRVLNLRGCTGVGDPGLLAVAASCRELMRLDVGECRHVTDAGISAIAAGCQLLERLDVRRAWSVGGRGRVDAGGADLVTDASLLAVAVHCPRMRHLGLRGTGVTSDGIVAIAQGCHHLRSLDVGRCRGVMDAAIIAITENCPLIEHVEHFATGVTYEGVGALLYHASRLTRLSMVRPDYRAIRLGADSCRRLRSLCMVGSCLTDAALSSLASRCSSLRTLEFAECEVIDDCLAAFAAHCPQLETLALWGCRAHVHEGMMAVAASCPQLRTFRLRNSKGVVTDATLAAFLRHCPSLHTLDLGDSDMGVETLRAAGRYGKSLRFLTPSLGRSGQQHSYFGDGGLCEALQGCTGLEMLRLSGIRAGLSDLALTMAGDSCKNLRVLDLVSCRGCFSPQLLEKMAPHLGALEVLDGFGCDAVTDGSLLALAQHCRRLRDVDVSQCNVGNMGVTALASHCRSLVVLNLSACYGVSDVGVAVVGETCSQLRELDLSYCGWVSREGVASVLSKCKKLQRLDLSHGSLELADVESVRGRWPHVDVVYGAETTYGTQHVVPYIMRAYDPDEDGSDPED